MGGLLLSQTEEANPFPDGSYNPTTMLLQSSSNPNLTPILLHFTPTNTTSILLQSHSNLAAILL